MDANDAVELIKPALWPPQSEKVWADLGSGKGLFTRALATLLERSTIHAVDKSGQTMEPSLNGNGIVFHQLDFSEDVLPLSQLDGILMANSLHFVKDKHRLLLRLQTLLRRKGQLLIVEYEMHQANRWVPYPVAYASLEAQLTRAGFEEIRLVGERLSIYGGRKMYACSAVNG